MTHTLASAFHWAQIFALLQWMLANPTEAATYLVAYSSAAVVVLAVIERFLRTIEDWLTQWFPRSSVIGMLDKMQYILSAASDLVEKLALNWRSAIAPKRDVDPAQTTTSTNTKAKGASAP